MPQPGKIIENPITGDIFEYLETAGTSNGERMVLKQTIKTKGHLYPNHFHTLQDESFEVLDGKLTIWLEGKSKTLSKGEKITLPKNKAHNHFNNDDEPATFIQTVFPALDFEYLLENIIGLTIDGKIHNGRAGLIQELTTLKYLDSKTFLPGIPIALQKLAMNLVGPIARWFGYRAVYKKYSGIEK